jgi:hypothetical protein
MSCAGALSARLTCRAFASRSGSHLTLRWREMDSNHRYRIRNNPFWLPPFGPRNSPSTTKTGSYVPGTDGSNPSPFSGESGANRTFGGASLDDNQEDLDRARPVPLEGRLPASCNSHPDGYSLTRPAAYTGAEIFG